MSENEQEIFYQDGPQAMFGACGADIALYGGAAGSGKSHAALLEPLHEYNNKYYKTVIFRRTTTQIRNAGGLWDCSRKVYPLVNATPNESFLSWRFPSGATVKFAGLEYDNSVFDFQGAQIPLIIWDELTTFTEYQFWFMLSRNRSDSGVPGRIRATCNPDVRSWVRKLIDWYIDHETGYPIKSRSGKIRWFIRENDVLEWFNSRKEIEKKYGKEKAKSAKSFTFISALLTDNKILMKNDPNYKSNLEAMSRVEKERLLYGNWNIEPSAGDIFDRNDFEIIEALPHGFTDAVRFWDKAGTKPSIANPDPDWTRGVKMLKYSNGLYVIADMRSLRDNPFEVNQLIKTTASQDGYMCRVKEQQDPGQAGKEEAANFVKLLAGYDVKAQPFSKNKLLRCAGVRAQVKARNVKILRAKPDADGTNWNEVLLDELHNYKGEKDERDDIVDCVSGSFNELAGVTTMDAASVNRMAQLLGG